MTISAFLHHGSGTDQPLSTETVEARRHGKPQPRMTRDGYTKRAGSPTEFQIRRSGEKIWRRVYVVCFSNAGTTFVKLPDAPFMVVQITETP